LSRYTAYKAFVNLCSVLGPSVSSIPATDDSSPAVSPRSGAVACLFGCSAAAKSWQTGGLGKSAVASVGLPHQALQSQKP